MDNFSECRWYGEKEIGFGDKAAYCYKHNETIGRKIIMTVKNDNGVTAIFDKHCCENCKDREKKCLKKS